MTTDDNATTTPTTTKRRRGAKAPATPPPTNPAPAPARRFADNDGREVVPAAAVAALEQEALLRAAGFDKLKPAWFAPGTKMLDIGVQTALKSLEEWEALPLVADGCRQLADTVRAERRVDHTVNLATLRVDHDGLARCAGVPLGMVLNDVAWSSLVARCPREVGGVELPRQLRNNVNLWIGAVEKKDVVLRTRNANHAAECYGIVSPGYQVFDLDQIAGAVGAAMPKSARVRVRYDGRSSSIQAMLHNPCKVDELGVSQVLHLTMDVRTHDDGTGGVHVRFKPVRIRCVNCTLLHDSKFMFSARHVGSKDIADVVAEGLKSSAEAMESFAEHWQAAFTERYTCKTSGDELDARETFQRLVAAGMVKVPHEDPAEMVDRLVAAFNQEPGNTAAHVNMAITRSAHTYADSWKSPWYQDDLEEQAGQLLYVYDTQVPELTDDWKEYFGVEA